MSTRCQLRFTEKGSDQVAQVYRHSDGYPESVLSLLDHLQELLNVTGTQRGSSYAAAQFILTDSLWQMERSFRRRNGVHNNSPDTVTGMLEPGEWEGVETTPSYLLGHGVEDPSCGIHGDEEYLYQIEIPPRDPFDEPSEWRVKVSDHCRFPLWNKEGTEQAFDIVDWQFEGTLTEAMSNLNGDR